MASLFLKYSESFQLVMAFILYSHCHPTVACQYSVVLTSGLPCALSDFRSRARPFTWSPLRVTRAYGCNGTVFKVFEIYPVPLSEVEHSQARKER